MLACGMYLYFEKNGITCSKLSNAITPEGYQHFLELMKKKINDEYISDADIKAMEEKESIVEKTQKKSKMHQAKSWLRKKFSRKKASPKKVLGLPEEAATPSNGANIPPNSPEKHEAWKTKLPNAYLNFETYKKTIQEVCVKGLQVCQGIKADNITNFRKRLRRKKCNSFCSARTCQDPFTLATCYAFASHSLDGLETESVGDDEAICPIDTVKNCLKNGHSQAFVQQLADRGWGDAWDQKKESKKPEGHEEASDIDYKHSWLKDHWDKVFFLTSTEPAKGKHIGLRIAQGGAVLATVAALPFVLHVAAPALMIKAGSWVSQYGVMKGVDEIRSSISDTTFDKIKKFVKKVSKAKLTSRMIRHCYCQCPG